MADWKKIKTEYITSETSYRRLAEKYGVGRNVIGERARAEKWVQARKEYRDKTVTKSIERIGEKTVDKMARIDALSDLLLDKLEAAVAELDLQLCTNRTKVKEIEYHNAQRPDKPTKETVTETETVEGVRSVIDRAGLRQLTAALKDIKEVKMLRSELDRQEQEARIANLRKQAQEETVSGAALVVEGLPEEFKV